MIGLGLGLSLGGGQIGAEPLASITYEPDYTNDNWFSTPSWMPTAAGKGPYQSTIVNVKDMPDIPADYIHFYTTDHSPSGTQISGVGARYGRGANPVDAVWMMPLEAVAAGWFDGHPNPPTRNATILSSDAVQNAAGFEQIETAKVLKYQGQLLLHFSASNATGGGVTQGTFRCDPNTDGVNFVLPATRAPLLQLSANTSLGTDHSGYFSPQENPYDELINPNTGLKWGYYGTSLAGSGDRTSSARWVTDDPTGSWTMIGNIQSSVGLYPDLPVELNGLRAGFGSLGVQKISEGLYSRLSSFAQQASGSAAPQTRITEQFVGPGGLELVRRAKPLPYFAPTAERTNGGSASGLLIEDGRWYMVYTYRNPSDRNIVGLASGPVRDAKYTITDLLIPDVTDLDTNIVRTMSGGAGIPPGWTLGVRGTPVGIAATGYIIQVQAGAAGTSEGSFYKDDPIIPSDYDYLHFSLEDVWETHSTLASRIFFLGLFNDKNVSMAAMTRGLYVSNRSAGSGANAFSGGTNSADDVYMHRLADGVDTTAISSMYDGFGLASNKAKNLRSFGIALFPQQKKAFLTGTGLSLLSAFPDLSAFDWDLPMYMGFNVRTSLTSGTTNSYTQTQRLIYREKLTA